MKCLAILRTLAYTVIAATLGGCATSSSDRTQSVSSYTSEELIARNDALLVRESELARREAQMRDQQSSSLQSSQIGTVNGLLPPDGKAGECYARVWVDPTYHMVEEAVLRKDASHRIEITPAVYKMVDERVLVSQASSRLETTPAVYETVTEEKQLSAGGLTWKIDLSENAAPVSNQLLDTATTYGVNLDTATPGMCYHEHFVPAKFEQVDERALVNGAYDVINVQEAQYQWVEKQVLVSDASTRLEEIPAVYETVTEQVVDIPAHTVWKKGTGPIQRIDDATGEIMCLVEIPATFKSRTKEVLVSPASAREVVIPARYELVKVKELVSAAAESRRTVPAEYKTIEVTKKVAEPTFVWHEVHDLTMSKQTRTGNQICLTEEKPRFETVISTVVKTPAQSHKIDIPADYVTMKVQKLVSPAKENVIEIPAEYETVSLRKQERDGYMEWRSILCETNMNKENIISIQQALKDRDYDPGKVDGVVGHDTMKAVNRFQNDNELPVDEYLNMETIKALGVRI